MEGATGIRRRPNKRPRLEVSPEMLVPKLHFYRRDHKEHSIAEVYKAYQAVHLPDYLQYIQQESTRGKEESESVNKQKRNGDATSLRWNDLHDLFTRLSKKDKDSFCVENSSSAGALSPAFLESKVWDAGYCSFQVQEEEYLSHLSKILPVNSLDDRSFCSGTSSSASSTFSCRCCRCWHYEPCLWVFFGRNPSLLNSEKKKIGDLKGRPEHTDSISHDGTWHYQLSGTKRWLLRPTRQLWNQSQARGDYANEEPPKTPVVIDCQQGDVLIINTRLWFHQTVIPPQPQPSVSYAKDFCINRVVTEATDHERSVGKGARMTNVDGLYATDDILEGTILFREDDMPDCAMHRSVTNPNCAVVELDDGTHAVVSIRQILAGEFFCVGDSTDEDDTDED
jgi:hypothetical protein